MDTPEVKSLESAVKQPAGMAAAAAETPQVLTRKDLERNLVADEHYKLENGRYVKPTGGGYRLEVELESAPANGDPLWYVGFFKISDGTDVQLCSVSGRSYDIAELQKLQDDVVKSCCVKKTKIAEF
jgi:hypothetical protein